MDSRAVTAYGGNTVCHCGVSGKIGSRASSIRAVQGNSGFPAGGDVRIAGHMEGSADPDAAQEVPDGSTVHGEGRVLCDVDTFCIRAHNGAAASAVGDGQRMASLHGEHIPVGRNIAARLDLLSVQTDAHIFIDFELPVDENVVFEIVVARRRGKRVGFVPCRPFHRRVRGVTVKVRAPAADAVAVLHPERRERVHPVRNRVAGSVEFSVVAAPHEIGAGVTVGTGQSLLCRCEKGNGRGGGVQRLDVFDDDADVTGSPADTAAVQVQGNGFHVVLRVLHPVGARDFQNRTVCCPLGREVRNVRKETYAVRTHGTELFVSTWMCILTPGSLCADNAIHIDSVRTVFDESGIFLEDALPLVVEGTGVGARSARGGMDVILYPVILCEIAPEDQILFVQLIPGHGVRDVVFGNKQRMFIFHGV